MPPRPGKAYAAPRPESYTWGMGGTLPQGKRYLPVPPAKDFVLSQKKYLVPRESEIVTMSEDLGRKGRVFDSEGVNVNSSKIQTVLRRELPSAANFFLKLARSFLILAWRRRARLSANNHWATNSDSFRDCSSFLIRSSN